MFPTNLKLPLIMKKIKFYSTYNATRYVRVKTTCSAFTLVRSHYVVMTRSL